MKGSRGCPGEDPDVWPLCVGLIKAKEGAIKHHAPLFSSHKFVYWAAESNCCGNQAAEQLWQQTFKRFFIRSSTEKNLSMKIWHEIKTDRQWLVRLRLTFCVKFDTRGTKNIRHVKLRLTFCVKFDTGRTKKLPTRAFLRKIWHETNRKIADTWDWD